MVDTILDMANAILDKILTVRGVSILTYALIAISLLIYLRIVVGSGLIQKIKSVPAMVHGTVGLGGGKKGGKLGMGLNKLREKTSGVSFSNPSYEEISMTGGDGRGTVSEVLARQTEIKILKGEEVEDDFTQDLAQGTTGVSQYDPYASSAGSANPWAPPAPQPEPEPEPEPEPSPPPKPEPKPAPQAPTAPKPAQVQPKKAEESVPSGFDFQFDGFSVGDSYDSPG